MANITVFNYTGVSTDELDLSALFESIVLTATPSTYVAEMWGELTTFLGNHLTYFGGGGLPTGGLVTAISHSFRGHDVFSITDLQIPARFFLNWALSNDTEEMRRAVLSEADIFTGGAKADLLRGYDGSDLIDGMAGGDTLDGGAGSDSLFGGDGNDYLFGGFGTNMLRGGAGDDVLLGGDGFDDTHGNQGNDTIHAGRSDDWVVGGQGNDVLFGDEGSDLIYGQLGDDILDGDMGADSLVGGQGDDILNGRGGNDLLTGDRGDDTLTGDLGADIFRTNMFAGIDRIMDFSFDQGDRVQIDPTTVYSVVQAGSDTIIDMGAGNQMILVGVQASSLQAGWIIDG